MIIVDESKLTPIINTIKRLPVRGDFAVSDAWVGVVMALQNIRDESPKYVEPERRSNTIEPSSNSLVEDIVTEV